MSAFDFIFTDTQGTPVQRRSLSDLVEHLQMVDILPGGNGQATFRIPSPTRSATVPNWLGYNYDVKITRRGRVVWRGRIEDFKRRRQSAGWPYFDITVGGYGLALKDEFDTARNVQNTETSTIVSNAITNLVPDITTTSITASGFTISNTSAVNLTRMNAAAQIAWAANFGDTGFADQLWYIYPDNDGTIRFTFKPRPTTPDLYLDEVDADSFDWGLSGYALTNRVRVQYNSAASFVSAEDTALQGAGPTGWDRIIELMAVVPQITQSADADQIASTLLTTFQNIRMRAEAGTFGASTLILDANRASKYLYEVRAGQLVQLKDVSQAAAPGTTLSYSNSFLIAEKTYDEDTDTLTLVPESFDTMIERSIARVTNVLQGLQQAS